MTPIRNTFLIFFCLLGLACCSKRNYNADAETLIHLPESEKGKSGFLKRKQEPLAAADTARPDLALIVDSTAQQQQKAKKRKAQKIKKEFLGYKIKRGIAKTGKSKNATTEIFYYLPTYVEPNPYAPAKYYYNTKRRKILKDATIDPKEARILHGPYKRMKGRVVVEEGFYYVGTRHLRWETYRQNNNDENILINKVHYEKGFPRDAIINYYDAGKTKIKEVIPYAEGKLNGDYVLFRPDGLLAWAGQYDQGRKVGVWIEYWPFRNRKRFEYQYPETAEDEPFEPVLLREYNRHSNLIYEKGKLDKRASAR
ncbi:MAG: toxin-antitoxin system YwqK family antitoxin [Adhaeribacter sp.]